MTLLPLSSAYIPHLLAIEQVQHANPWTKGMFEACFAAGYTAWGVWHTSVEQVDESLPFAMPANIAVLAAYTFCLRGVGQSDLLNITTAPAFCRQGLARQLLQALCQHEAQAGQEEMLLEVRQSNVAAIALYQSLGFSTVGRRKGYYPPVPEGATREDAWVMAKALQDFTDIKP